MKCLRLVVVEIERGKNFFKLFVFMCVQDRITTFNEMKGNLKTHSCSFSYMYSF